MLSKLVSPSNESDVAGIGTGVSVAGLPSVPPALIGPLRGSAAGTSFTLNPAALGSGACFRFGPRSRARPETANAAAVRAIGEGEAAGSAAFWPAAINHTAAAINAAGNKPVAIRYFILDLSPASGF